MMARSSFALRIKFLLCLALAQSGLVHSFMFDEEIKATISPSDALVFIGETLKVECTLSEDTTDISTRDMYFNVSDNKVDYTPWTIPQEDIIFENRRILADIKIPNNCSEYITIMCRTKDVNNLFISAAVFVERAIQNITNFSGVYYYDSGTITVTWNLGKTYLNPSSMSINAEWSPDKPANLGGNYCASEGNEYCSINYTGSDIIYFRVNVSIALGERPSEQYLVPLYETFAVSDNKFVTIDNMKTGPPKSLTVVDTSATCVNFTWKDNKYFSSDILTDEIYRVDIKMDRDEEFNVSIESAVKLNSTEIVQLCELYPDTKYILTVQVKAKNINPWSDSAIVEFITKEDQPLTGPPLTDTSYYTEDCVNNNRNVLVYWNDLSKLSLRGTSTKIEVVRNNNTMLLRSSSNYYEDNLQCDSDNQILVYSATAVGLSLEPSIIIIPRKSEELAINIDLEFRVEDTSVVSETRSLVNVSITWDPSGLTEKISLILYMCQETYTPNTCFNDFTTKEQSVDKRTLVLNNIPSSTNLFGYALRDDKGNKRGIQWTNCIYRADIRPTQPTGLHVSPGSQANSLFISWTSTPCSKSTKVLILQYRLYVCTQPVSESEITAYCSSFIIENLKMNTYTATDLKGGQRYYVYIQAMSPKGIGPLSNPVDQTPNSSSGDIEEIIGPVFGVLAFVFLLGFACFCLVRYCKKSEKRIKNLNENPPILKTFPTELSHQDSSESGIGTGNNSNQSSCSVEPIYSECIDWVPMSTPESNTVRKDVIVSLDKIDKEFNNTPVDINNSHTSSKYEVKDYVQCADTNSTPDRWDEAGECSLSDVVSNNSIDLSCPKESQTLTADKLVATKFTAHIANFKSQALFCSPQDNKLTATCQLSAHMIHSAGDHCQFSTKSKQLTTLLYEAPTKNTDNIEKQVVSSSGDPTEEVNSPNLDVNSQQCSDCIICYFDGKLHSTDTDSGDTSAETYVHVGLNDYQGASTCSSQEQNTTFTTSVDNRTDSQCQTLSVTSDCRSLDPDDQHPVTQSDFNNTQEANDSSNSIDTREQMTQFIAQIVRSSNCTKKDNASQKNQSKCSIAISSLDTHASVPGAGQSHIKRDPQTQVVADGSDKHLQTNLQADTSNQRNMDISDIPEITDHHEDQDQGSCTGYIAVKSLQRDEDDLCDSDSHCDDTVDPTDDVENVGLRDVSFEPAGTSYEKYLV